MEGSIQLIAVFLFLMIFFTVKQKLFWKIVSGMLAYLSICVITGTGMENLITAFLNPDELFLFVLATLILLTVLFISWRLRRGDYEEEEDDEE